MLKNCFYPVQYNNILNKTVGEIICQSEASFTIVCNLCELKIFQFNEFVKHFRRLHWSDTNEEAIICKTEQDNGNDSLKSTEKHIIKTETIVESDNEEVIYEEYALDEPVKDNHYHLLADETNHDKKESYINDSINEEEGSCDSYQPLTILKKQLKSSKKKKGSQFKCTICTRTFTTKYYFDIHLQKHKDSQFQCSKCNRVFAKELQLIHHQYLHNGYPCQECGKRFTLKSSLQYHLDTHKGEKKFICDFDNCGKAFMNKRRLTAHQNVHYSNTECVCEICGSRQRNKNSLRDHIRTHTGERPFACALCDHRFTSRSLLYEHKACHETERKHICDVCGKDFNRQKALYHHKHLHLGIKKFICKICGSAYAQAAGLSAHMRKHKLNCS